MSVRQAEPGHQLGVGNPRQGLIQLVCPGQGGPHLAETPALDQREVVLHHLAALPEVEQFDGGHARRQAILAAAQALLGQIEAPVQAQPETPAQQTVALQTVEQAAGRGAARNLQQTLLGEYQGLFERGLLLPDGERQRQSAHQQAAFQQQQPFSHHVSGTQ